MPPVRFDPYGRPMYDYPPPLYYPPPGPGQWNQHHMDTASSISHPTPDVRSSYSHTPPSGHNPVPPPSHTHRYDHVNVYPPTVSESYSAYHPEGRPPVYPHREYQTSTGPSLIPNWDNRYVMYPQGPQNPHALPPPPPGPITSNNLSGQGQGQVTASSVPSPVRTGGVSRIENASSQSSGGQDINTLRRQDFNASGNQPIHQSPHFPSEGGTLNSGGLKMNSSIPANQLDGQSNQSNGMMPQSAMPRPINSYQYQFHHLPPHPSFSNSAFGSDSTSSVKLTSINSPLPPPSSGHGSLPNYPQYQSLDNRNMLPPNTGYYNYDGPQNIHNAPSSNFNLNGTNILPGNHLMNPSTPLAQSNRPSSFHSSLNMGIGMGMQNQMPMGFQSTNSMLSSNPPGPNVNQIDRSGPSNVANPPLKLE